MVAKAQRRKPAGAGPSVEPLDAPVVAAPPGDPAAGGDLTASAAEPGPGTGPVAPAGTRARPALDAYAAKWAKAIQKAGFVPMSAGELRGLLRGLAARFIDALHAEEFDCAPAAAIGAALAETGCTSPEMLRVTLSVLRDPPRDPPRDGAVAPVQRSAAPKPRRSERLARLHAHLAAGYATALRNRTLVEQERLTRAIVAAHADVERALWDSESRFRALFEGAATGIGMADVDGRIIQANAALGILLGYTADELCAMSVRDLAHPDNTPITWAELAERVQAGDHLRMERAYYRKDGSVVWTDVTLSLLRDASGVPLYTVAMVEDITARHELEERLRYQALHDPLTGLPNRTFFAERLAEAFAATDPDTLVGLCYLDLDGFKRINDSLGHDVGDRLLVAVAKRLQRTAAARGHLVARMGGDEFVILSEKADHDELTTLADQVLYSLDLPVRSGPHGMRVSASIGIVAQPVGTSGPAEILKAADLTLYRAKAAGRGRWARYDAELNAAQVARYALAEELPEAVQRGEFKLLYQPLVSLRTGQACGVEALLRWHHPERGTLSPDQFIDLAEESGVISAIGGWVLREACRQAATWWRRFPDREFYVSVNIATAQTYDPALVGDVLSILHESGLPATLLQLELTESAMLTEIAPVEALRALAEAGIRIAIDDFGTGYSNLAYLKTLPVAGLKLARQFTDGLGTPVDTHIVKTLIELAHVLDLAVTAEGVETAEQLDQLNILSCDVAQGWHLSMPLPADEMTAVLEAEAEAVRPPAGGSQAG